jgi:vanillate monooxygenase ferredoxin subunit
MTNQLKFPMIVRRVRQETEDIRSFELVSLQGELPPVMPGAHIDVQTPSEAVRPYSLCNGPEQRDSYLIGVKREPASRGGSASMHSSLNEGDVLRVGLPRENFPLQSSARHHLMIAGGIGITPLLSMARHLHAARADYRLLYFTRSAAQMAFRAELAALGNNAIFHPGVTPSDLPSLLNGFLATRRQGEHLYFCGPEPFMELIEHLARPVWPVATVHSERFSPVPRAGRPTPEREFDVRLALRGLKYRIPPDSTIVEVLGAHGIQIETSCEMGVCGTCATEVCGGIPDHRDQYLTDAEKAEGRQIMACVSRSLSPELVLNL